MGYKKKQLNASDETLMDTSLGAIPGGVDANPKPLTNKQIKTGEPRPTVGTVESVYAE